MSKKEASAAEPKPTAAAEPTIPPEARDPRLKVMKKLQGRFLPKGPLRDRYKVLLERWNTGEDHGGVTFDELKSLHSDWKIAREKRSRPAGE